jgi:dihydroorotate dehydrogenase (fumarate)
MDFSTRYLGLKLDSPIAASASPLTGDPDTIRRLEDAGAAAVVLPSLFEEQINAEEQEFDYFSRVGTERFAESLTYFPDPGDYRVGPSDYLALVRAAVSNCDIPVIASLNGVTLSGWSEYARQIEEAGAAAVELNVYLIPTELDVGGDEVEQRYLHILQQVKEAVSIPVAMKLSPYFSAMANMAQKLDAAGADGLVLFNRFYQPDFDTARLEVTPTLELSSPYEVRLPLLWTAVLAGKLQASLAAGTGVHTGNDAAKYLLAGADVVMATSSLLHRGPEHMTALNDELKAYMEEMEYESVAQMQGAMSQESVADPSAFERANYIKILKGYGHTEGL